MLDRGVDMVLAEARLRFLRPARFDDELELAVVVTHLGRTSFRTRHTAGRNGELIAECELRHVLVERRTGIKTPLPDWLRDGIVPWTVSDAPAETVSDAPAEEEVEPTRGRDGPGRG
jgi:acyl-CoA thioester hydrolase